MTKQIYKIIEEINKEIGAVPVDKDGFYTPSNHRFVLGLYRAKDIIERVVKEAEHGETA